MKLKKTIRSYMMLATMYTTFCIARALNPLVVMLYNTEWYIEHGKQEGIAWIWIELVLLLFVVAAAIWVVRLIARAAYKYIWE